MKTFFITSAFVVLLVQSVFSQNDFALGFYHTWNDPSNGVPPAGIWQQLDTLQCNIGMYGKLSNSSYIQDVLDESANHSMKAIIRQSNTYSPRVMSKYERSIYFTGQWGFIEVDNPITFFNTMSTGEAIIDDLVYQAEVEDQVNYSRKVVKCISGSDLPGNIASGLTATPVEWAKEQSDNEEYKVKIRLKVPEDTDTHDHDPIVRVTVTNTNGTFVKSLYTDDLDGMDLSKYLEIDPFLSFNQNAKTSKMNVDDPDFSMSEDLGQANTKDVDDVAYEVYWFGEIDVRFDYIKVDDAHSDDLFIGNYDSSILNSVAAFGNDPALSHLFLIDEPTFDQFRTGGYNNNLLAQNNYKPGITSHNKAKISEEFALLEDLPEFTFHAYPIRNGVPIPPPYNTYDRINNTEDKWVDLYVNEQDYNTKLQTNLDNNLFYRMNPARKYANKYNKPLWHVPQLISCKYKEASTMWVRSPTPEELNALIYIPLSYGVKGILYFMYHDYVATFTNPHHFMGGLVERGPYTQSGITFLPDQTALNHSNNTYHISAWNETIYTGNSEKWATLMDLNPKVKTLLETLKDLDSDSVFSEDNLKSPFVSIGNWSRNNPENPKPYGDIQFGTFDNVADTSYFMIVNKQCFPEATQSFTVGIQKSANTCYIINDVLEEKDYIFIADAAGIVHFTPTLLPGEGRLFKMYTYSDTWSGELCVSDDLIISGSKTISINPGTILKFKSQVKCEIEDSGVLAAYASPSDSIIFTRIDVDNSWYGFIVRENAMILLDHCSVSNSSWGIYFDDNSLGEISSCTFSGHSRGMYIERSAPSITSCTFKNCVEGIRFYHAYNPPNWNNEFVTGNIFQNCTSIGIFFIDSSPFVKESQIINNYRGAWLVVQSEPIFDQNTITSTEYRAIYCVSSSCPDLYYNNYYQKGGYNVIQSNADVGIYAASGSFPVLGDWPLNAGYNTIMNNGGYEVYNANSTNILAEFNWWGSGSGPSSGEIYGPVDWFPPLTSQPSKGQSVNDPQVTNDPSFLPEELEKAYADHMSGDFKSAATIFKDYFINNPDYKFAQRACVEYAKSCDCYLKSEEILTEFDNTRNQIKNNELLFTLSDAKITVMSRASMFKEAMAEIDKACEMDLSRNQENQMSIQKAYMYIYDLDEPEKGRICLEEVLNKSSTGDENNELALYELGFFEDSKQQSLAKSQIQEITQTVPIKFELLSAYPNPFNPSTTFRFSSPWQGKIKIEIYDALGQRVRVLDHIKFSTGYNEVLWDGKNDQGSSITSGIYLVRYIAESTANAKDHFQGYSKVIFLK